METGITQQQLMRKQFGIYVRHKGDNGKFEAQIIKDEKIVKVLPDDCLATGTIFISTKIFDVLEPLKSLPLKYPSATGSSCINGKITDALKYVDFAGFEKNILPALRKSETGLNAQIQTYDHFKGDMSEGGRYILFDTLFRIFLYMRHHNIRVQRTHAEDLEAVTFEEALQKGVTSVKAVLIQAEYEESTLLKICSSGLVLLEDGSKIFIVNGYYDPFSLIKGAVLDFNAEDVNWEVQVASPAQTSNVEGKTWAEVMEDVLEDSIWSDLTAGIYKILPKPQQKLSPEDVAFINYGSDLIGAGKSIGANALRGLGKIAGEGLLVDSLKRVACHIKERGGSKISMEQSARLAAAKMARMQSVKKVDKTDRGLFFHDVK